MRKVIFKISKYLFTAGVAALFVLAFAINVHAAEASVKFGSATYTHKDGEAFAVGLYVNVPAGVGPHYITIKYDPSALEYQGGGTGYDLAQGQIFISSVGGNGASSQKYMLTFKPKRPGDSGIAVISAKVQTSGTPMAVLADGSVVPAVAPVDCTVTEMGSAPIHITADDNAQDNNTVQDDNDHEDEVVSEPEEDVIDVQDADAEVPGPDEESSRQPVSTDEIISAYEEAETPVETEAVAVADSETVVTEGDIFAEEDTYEFIPLMYRPLVFFPVITILVIILIIGSISVVHYTRQFVESEFSEEKNDGSDFYDLIPDNENDDEPYSKEELKKAEKKKEEPEIEEYEDESAYEDEPDDYDDYEEESVEVTDGSVSKTYSEEEPEEDSQSYDEDSDEDFYDEPAPDEEGGYDNLLDFIEKKNSVKVSKALQKRQSERIAEMYEKPVISVDDVTMVFKLATYTPSGIKDYIIRLLKRNISYRKLYALYHISFDVFKGEIVGIIGTNGSGKSTLLKIISGALVPTSGKVTVDRKKIQFLTLGTGFDYELTARENVYLNGSIIGYSKDFLDEHYDEIVDFAELHDYMEQPVKNFSSGMVSRLGFAIATAGDAAEILILDEVLSVGDEFFRQKSLARVKEMIHSGSTVLLVSHSMQTILDNCTKCVWIERGEMKMVGDPKKVCDAYKNLEAESTSLS